MFVSPADGECMKPLVAFIFDDLNADKCRHQTEGIYGDVGITSGEENQWRSDNRK